MLSEREYNFCDVVYNAALKYNLYQFDLYREHRFIEDLEDILEYSPEFSVEQSASVVNKVFLIKLINILLCDVERGNDDTTELFENIQEVFSNLKNLIETCTNKKESRFEYIDTAVTHQKQVEFLSKNTKDLTQIIYSLILFHINYYIKNYCENEL